ncbi:MAG: hypothetical protein JWM27_3567 [Gemmatimonadetes bacterium]|nr:hypothetical protein [Gemmatimonadota bacterium]
MSQTLQPSTGTSTTGMAPNVAAALSYVFAPIGGLVFFYALEKENAFVRFHAAQSIVFGVACIALSFAINILFAILGSVPGLGLVSALIAVPVSLVVAVAEFVFWVMAVSKAYGDQEYQIPIIGAQARRLLLSAPPA